MEEKEDLIILSDLLERARISHSMRIDKITLSSEEVLAIERLSLKERLSLLEKLHPTRVKWAPAQPQMQLEGINLRMVAEGWARLHLHLQKNTPFDLNEQFRDLALFDYGSESLVLLAKDNKSNKQVVIKVAFCDYTDISGFDLEKLQRRRERLVKEANILTIMKGTALPIFLDLVKSTNPLFPKSFPDFIRSTEVFLLMEPIFGVRVDIQARRFHKLNRVCCAQKLAVDFAIASLALQLEIFKRLGKSIYTDIKPENALLVDDLIRIVDGSSIMLAEDEGVSYPKVSPLYLEPRDVHSYFDGTLRPDEGYVFRGIARCAQILACNSPAIVGAQLPAWASFILPEIKSAFDMLATCHSASLTDSIGHLTNVKHYLICNHG
jgi:serine/threonine protein kinase